MQIWKSVRSISLLITLCIPFHQAHAQQSADECEADLANCPTIKDITISVGGDISHYNGLTGGGYLGADPWQIVIIDSGVVANDPNLDASSGFPSGCFSPDMTCNDNSAEAINSSYLGNPLQDGKGYDHGTAVAMMASASGYGEPDSEDADAVGLATEVNIISLRVSGAIDVLEPVRSAPERDPEPDTIYSSDILKALEYVDTLLDQGRRIAVVNLSLGYPHLGLQLSNEVCDSTYPEFFATIQNLRDRGVLVVAAAGNSGSHSLAGYPACLSNVLSVSSSLFNGDLDDRSSQSGKVDILAPGSALIRDIRQPADSTQYTPEWGSSIAAPVVSAAAAVLYDCAARVTTSGGERQGNTDDLVEQALLSVGSRTTTFDGKDFTYKNLDVATAMRYLAQPDATQLVGASGSYSANTMCATVGGLDPQLPAGGSVIAPIASSTTYNWTAPFSGSVALSTCNDSTTASTWLAVHSGNYDFSGAQLPTGGLQLVTSADSGEGCNENEGARVEFDAISGENYVFQVGPISAYRYLHPATLTSSIDSRLNLHGRYRLEWSMQQTVPDRPTIIAPDGFAESDTPTFSWQAVDGASWYMLYISDEQNTLYTDWITALDAGCSTGDECRVSPALKPYGVSSWWVLAWNNSGSGPWSTGTRFLANQYRPPVPELISAISSGDGSAPVFRWNPVNYANWYQLWLSVDGVKVFDKWYVSTELGCLGGLSGCEIESPISLNDNTTWWVRGWSERGYGSWSVGAVYNP